MRRRCAPPLASCPRPSAAWTPQSWCRMRRAGPKASPGSLTGTWASGTWRDAVRAWGERCSGGVYQPRRTHPPTLPPPPSCCAPGGLLMVACLAAVMHAARTMHSSHACPAPWLRTVPNVCMQCMSRQVAAYLPGWCGCKGRGGHAPVVVCDSPADAYHMLLCDAAQPLRVAWRGGSFVQHQPGTGASEFRATAVLYSPQAHRCHARPVQYIRDDLLGMCC